MLWRKWTAMGGVCLGLYATALPAAPVTVDGAWLEARLHDPKLVVVDMSDEDVQYLRFHPPGAIRLPYAALIKLRKDASATRLEDQELAELLGVLGITREHHVVIYDDLGGLNAARLFWDLERIGHPEVSVLDGGLVAWILKGRKVDNKSVIPAPTNYRLGGGGRANEARLHEIRKASEKGAGRLLDVRSAEEYAGDPKDPRTGHAPRARHWSWDQAVDFAGGFVRRDRQTLLQSLKEAGVGGRKTPIIVYCRSGRRAAQTYLTLRDLGYESVKIYAEFISEYSAASTAPLKQGKEP